MKVVVISQARMTSTRLPGKVLKPVMGKPLLEYQIERLQRSRMVDDLVIATTTNYSDDVLADFCHERGVHCYRGSEHDVLSRYYGAAKMLDADVIVRVTSDCPVIDPQVVDEVIGYYLENEACFDYVTNREQYNFPRGMDTEVFPVRVLGEAYVEATAPYEREHVTPFIYVRHDGRYRLGGISFTGNAGHHRWTVDTPEDFELLKRIIESLYPANNSFSLADILELLDAHPDWVKINAHVRHKALLE